MPPLPGVEYRGIGFSQPNTPRVPVAGTGEGLQQIAAAGKYAANVLDEMADEDGRVFTGKFSSDVRLNKLKEIQDAEMSGQPLDGLTDRISKSIEEEFAAAAKADGTPSRAAKYLELAKTDLLGDLSLSAQRLEATDKVNRRIAGLSDMISSSANAAALDPKLFPKVYAEAKMAIETTAMPFEARVKARNDLRDIAKAAVASQIDRDPYSGRDMVAQFQKSGYLEADEAMTLGNSADAAIRSREAEARARAAEGRAAAAEAANDYLAGFDDYAAYVAAGNVPDAKLAAKYSPAAIASLPIKNADKLAKKAADALARGSVMLSLREDPSPENRAKVLAEAQAAADNPENFQFNQDTFRMVAADVQAFDEKLNKTPGDVAWQSSRVQDAIKSGDGVSIVSASIAEQERLGVPEWKRQPLAESYAASVAEQIASLPPDQQAGAVQELATSYGAYWPEVFKQVGPKLPGALAVAAVMPPGRAATRLAEAASVPVADLKVGLDKDVSTNIEDAMRDDERLQSLSQVLSSQVGGAKTLAQYNDAIMRSAFQYVREGKSEAEAVAQATIDVTEDIDFRDVGLSTVAIPKASNPDMVEAGMSALVSQIDVSTLDLPPSVSGMNEADLKAAYASSIRRNGQWVPDGSGKGVYLYVEGDPVTRGGAPVLFTWDDLKAAGLPKDGFMFEGQR